MSHSPLKMFRQFHDKHVLVNGQGPIKEIAHNLGFTHVTTTDEFSHRFPNLDKMSHTRRMPAVSNIFGFIICLTLWNTKQKKRQAQQWSTVQMLELPNHDKKNDFFYIIPLMAAKERSVRYCWSNSHSIQISWNWCLNYASQIDYTYHWTTLWW